jgi:hypothetical protein
MDIVPESQLEWMSGFIVERRCIASQMERIYIEFTCMEFRKKNIMGKM